VTSPVAKGGVGENQRQMLEGLLAAEERNFNEGEKLINRIAALGDAMFMKALLVRFGGLQRGEGVRLGSVPTVIEGVERE